jgi:uncharacterized protein YbjT (DUF2867 family)
MQQPTIFVSGVTGNVGYEVARALMGRGVRVRTGDLDTQKVRARLGEGVEAVHFDFEDASTYPQAFAGIQRMFLMRPPQISNVRRKMFPAIDAAAAAGVSHFVFLSLIGVQRNKRVPHYAIEQHLRKLGVKTTFLRCSFFMQNFNTTHRDEIRRRSELYIPARFSKTSFIDVRDIAAVAALALVEGEPHINQAYDLTGSEALDYTQVAERFSQVLRRKIIYRNPPALGYVLRQLRAGKPLGYALITAWLYANTRKGMADVVTGDVRRLLGRKPISLRQYIQDYRESWAP